MLWRATAHFPHLLATPCYPDSIPLDRHFPALLLSLENFFTFGEFHALLSLSNCYQDQVLIPSESFYLLFMEFFFHFS